MRIAIAVAIAVVVAVTLGCPGRDPQTIDDGLTAGEGEGAEGEGAAGEGEGVGEGEGEGGGPDRTFECDDTGDPVDVEASCAAASDCAVGLVQVDCNGSLAATGVSADQLGAFNFDADGCIVTECDGIALPTIADDGTHQQGDEEPTVDCVADVCTTSFGT